MCEYDHCLTSHPYEMRAEFDMSLVPYWIDKLIYPESRENALKVLSKKRDLIPDLGPLLWNSFGSFGILLTEITKAYTYVKPPTLSDKQSVTVCNALALMQSIASHPETKPSVMKAGIALYLYPLFRTDDKRKAFEYLRLASLGVIGALVKDDDKSAVFYLLKSEIIPSCLKLMENGTELCRTLVTFILQRILKEDVGTNFICSCWYKLTEVLMSLEHVILSLARNPSARLLKHVLRCYLHLSRDPTAVKFVRAHLPLYLRDGTFTGFLHQHNLYDLYLELLTNLNLGKDDVGALSLSSRAASVSSTANVSPCCTANNNVNPYMDSTVNMPQYCSAGVLPVGTSASDPKLTSASSCSPYYLPVPCDTLGPTSYPSTVIGPYLYAPNIVTVSPDVSEFGSNKMCSYSGAVTVSSGIPESTSVSHYIPTEVRSRSSTHSIHATSPDIFKTINAPLYSQSSGTYKAIGTQHVVTSNYSPYSLGVSTCNNPDYFTTCDSPSPNSSSTVDTFPDSLVSNRSLHSSTETLNISSGNLVQTSQYSPSSSCKSKYVAASCDSLSSYSSDNIGMPPGTMHISNYSPNVNISIVPNGVNLCSYSRSAYGTSFESPADTNMSLNSSLKISSNVGTPNVIGSTCYSPNVTAGVPYVPGTLLKSPYIQVPSSSCTINESPCIPQSVGVLPYVGTVPISPYASCPIGMPYVPSAIATYYISVMVSTVADTLTSVTSPSYVGKSLQSSSTVTTSSLSSIPSS